MKPINRNPQVLPHVLCSLGCDEGQVYSNQDSLAGLLVDGWQSQQLLEVPEDPLQMPSPLCHSADGDGLHRRVVGEVSFDLGPQITQKDQDIPVNSGFNVVSEVLHLWFPTQRLEFLSVSDQPQVEIDRCRQPCPKPAPDTDVCPHLGDQLQAQICGEFHEPAGRIRGIHREIMALQGQATFAKAVLDPRERFH